MKESKEEIEIFDGPVEWADVGIADNGFIVEWTERHENKCHRFDDCQHIRRKQLFTLDQEDATFDLFKRIKKKELEWRRKSSNKEAGSMIKSSYVD